MGPWSRSNQKHAFHATFVTSDLTDTLLHSPAFAMAVVKTKILAVP